MNKKLKELYKKKFKCPACGKEMLPMGEGFVTGSITFCVNPKCKFCGIERTREAFFWREYDKL